MNPLWYALGGVLLGGLITASWMGYRGQRREEMLRAEKDQALRQEQEQCREKEEELARERERRIHAQKDLENAEKNLKTVGELERELGKQFENLSNRIYEEKRKRFAEESRSAVQQLLEPVREDLQGFRRKTEELHRDAGKDSASLREHLHRLMDANTQISDEARSLTRALKGDSGMRGNWGEMVLERLLEESGLEKGREYEVQQSMSDARGKRLRPDILISLPEGRHVVIDSKVSLVDWERSIALAEEAPQESQDALTAHTAAVRRHVQTLGEKRYQDLEHVQGADLVLMFVPIEAAYLEALRRDPDLYQEAWRQRIAVVGPTTLLAVLRIVENLWRIDQGNRNAREITRQGAAMYDKLAGFVDTLDKVGKALDSAQQSYAEAHKQLSTGRGNLLRRAEQMRGLGLQPKKRLPEASAEEAATDGAGMAAGSAGKKNARAADGIEERQDARAGDGTEERQDARAGDGTEERQDARAGDGAAAASGEAKRDRRETGGVTPDLRNSGE